MDPNILAVMAGSNTEKPAVIAITHLGPPYISVYRWSSATGFGEMYTDPSVSIPDTAYSVAFSPDGDAIAVAHNSSPYISSYRWSYASGFGAKYTNPSQLPVGSRGNAVAWSPGGQQILLGMVSTSNGERLIAYNWSYGSGYGMKHITTGINTAVNGVAWSPDGGSILAAIEAGGTHSVILLRWTITFESGAGQGSFGDSANGVTFSPDGSAIAIAQPNSPYIKAYRNWTPVSFGNPYPNPSSLPNNDAKAVAFSPDGDAIAVAHAGSPYISVYRWSYNGGFGTKYSPPNEILPGRAESVAFSPDGQAIAISHLGNPYISVYRWSSATGFGERYTNANQSINGTGWSVAFFS